MTPADLHRPAHLHPRTPSRARTPHGAASDSDDERARRNDDRHSSTAAATTTTAGRSTTATHRNAANRNGQHSEPTTVQPARLTPPRAPQAEPRTTQREQPNTLRGGCSPSTLTGAPRGCNRSFPEAETIGPSDG